jgi:hypothetical protein
MRTNKYLTKDEEEKLKNVPKGTLISQVAKELGVTSTYAYAKRSSRERPCQVQMWLSKEENAEFIKVKKDNQLTNREVMLAGIYRFRV